MNVVLGPLGKLLLIPKVAMSNELCYCTVEIFVALSLLVLVCKFQSLLLTLLPNVGLLGHK